MPNQLAWFRINAGKTNAIIVKIMAGTMVTVPMAIKDSETLPMEIDSFWNDLSFYEKDALSRIFHKSIDFKWHLTWNVILNTLRLLQFSRLSKTH